MESVPVTKLLNFIGTERRRYAGDDDNRFAFAMSQVHRYLQFAQIAEHRQKDANTEVVAIFRRRMRELDSVVGTRELTIAEIAELEVEGKLQALLHYEIESYIIFSKILLDKIAQFVEDYFGTVRGNSLQSHDKWCKALRSYTSAKGVQLPVGMPEVMQRLGSMVAEYRDKHITHFRNPRALHFTHVTGEGMTQIGTNHLYPKDSDTVTTSPLVNEIAITIDQYVDQLIALIENNREKSRFKMSP